jgi:hypothetical protein
MLDTLQAAIDLAWDYTDDPDECAKLSEANGVIEQLRVKAALAQANTALRQGLLTIEGLTGHLDSDAIHGIEDDAVDLMAWMASL